MYDLDMNKETGAGTFRSLFKKADEYDNFLKTEYGCLDRLEE
jgi:serine protease Do